MTQAELISLLEAALRARVDLFDTRHESALRLFNGFTEGYPDLVVELFARTIVLNNYAAPPTETAEKIPAIQNFLLQELPWVTTVVLKTRHGVTPEERQGIVLYGDKPNDRIREHGVWYAIDLMLNRDASIYLDTRNLRAWALQNLKDKRVLNCFAYTGSLGVAARAGGAARVVHLDLNRAFLNVAKTSYTLNGFAINKTDFQSGDFWTQISGFKRKGELFDCVILDAPFFSVTDRGRVDLVNNSQRLINKVRPLVADGGVLIAINNALFVSGQDYYALLEELTRDGYLSIEELLPVPADFIGYPDTRVASPPVDPSPFNHPTKIAVLRVRRKNP